MNIPENDRLVCVIVPVYRVEPYLRRCVDSILNQSHKSFELVLVEDGSPDGCPRICDEYAAADSRIRVIHQENMGLSGARNSGLDWLYAGSAARWITFVDSDDWVHPEYLHLLLEANLRFDTAISTARYSKALDGDSFFPADGKMYPVSPERAYFTAKGDLDSYVWGRLYDRRCFENRRFPLGKTWEDLFVLPQILFGEKTVSLVDSVLYHYYINPGGIVLSGWTVSKLNEIEAFETAARYFETCGGGALYPLALTRLLSSLEQARGQIRRAKNLPVRQRRDCLQLVEDRAQNILTESAENHPDYYAGHLSCVPLRWLRFLPEPIRKKPTPGQRLRYGLDRLRISLYRFLWSLCTDVLGPAGFEKLKRRIRKIG